MKAEVEWLTGVVRGGPEFKKHGDPYTFVCTILRRGTHAEIIGAVGNQPGELNMKMARAIWLELKRQGIETVNWERAGGKQVKGVVEDY